VIKQLLRQFKPGEDRFAGLDVQACRRPRRSAQEGCCRARACSCQSGRVQAQSRCLAGAPPHAGCSVPDVRRCAPCARQESEESGCAILPGNAAYLEAEVVNRLEAGDHWLVYARVNAGKVGPPAVPASQVPPWSPVPGLAWRVLRSAGRAMPARGRPCRGLGAAAPSLCCVPGCDEGGQHCERAVASCGRPARVQVVQEGALSAVHHRKVGTTY
jgi:flavin reductase (DIM6/NTAB) family NADH-FMN oxidoreductase RutF